MSEQHQVFHASTVYFKADASASSRRAASIGPGTSLNLDDPTLDWDLDDLEGGQIPEDARLPDTAPPSNDRNAQPHPADPYPRSRRGARQVSVDSHIYHRLPPVSQSISHPNDDYDIPPYLPVDPASPSLASPSTSLRSPSTSAAQVFERSPNHRPTLEELRSELNTSLQNYSTHINVALHDLLNNAPHRPFSRLFCLCSLLALALALSPAECEHGRSRGG